MRTMRVMVWQSFLLIYFIKYDEAKKKKRKERKLFDGIINDHASI